MKNILKKKRKNAHLDYTSKANNIYNFFLKKKKKL